MEDKNEFDVIIIGGSYAGLSAAMTLGRALRNVLVIDSGKPCNIQTPFSHNLITQDGKTPKEISSLAKEQVQQYDTVKFHNGLAVKGRKTKTGFTLETEKGALFTATKLILATGVKDLMPNIKGFSDCWGISILHCPYCHGYEYKGDPTGILANGDSAFEFAKLINNWTTNLTIFTNGPATLTNAQLESLSTYHININETKIDAFNHVNGLLESISFVNGEKASIKALYARPEFEQHCKIPIELGCELSEQNHIIVDSFQKTTVDGVHACGDNAAMFRAVSYAIATGTIAGAMTNRSLIEENF
ncbi:NAD(P)/FAD-dependent oxidoreductase [Zobellia nedashkovskayae]|uniref:NAD(P)/FAD-dependent oxidoreductase n=1 Tax=Zobellia nedashkovskayae TaxID=2779510 RepID=UPI00188AE7E1|nr:NAD(P)/FAD-dependent oxidoreductase [Zobellia nedashkovskayae]